MKLTYTSEFRPNFEIYQSLVWLSSGALGALVLVVWVGVPADVALVFTVPFTLLSAAYLVGAARYWRRRRRIASRTVNFLSLEKLADEMVPNSLVLGYGFDWLAAHTQRVADLYQDHDLLDRIRAGGKGATFLHGLGIEQERVLSLTDEETKGHVLIVGTTGAGKTRLFDLLVTQSVLRGEPTIIIDPKGDHELKSNCEAAYRRAGRGEDFAFFHPAFPDESCAIDPLANYQRESELASRLAAIIPSDGKGDVFVSYSQNALMSIFYGIIAGGEPPTILDIHEPLTQGSARIVYRAVERWASRTNVELPGKLASAYGGSDSDNKKAAKAVGFYQAYIAEDARARDHDLDGLIGLFLHDDTHFSKMVASLIPVIGQLCSGSLKELLSSAPQRGRLPASGKVVNLANIVSGRRGLYVGLDTLSDGIVGSRIGQLLLADLAALAGSRYNFASSKGFVNIFVDEASEVVTDKLIQLLNKGRGAGFRLFVATQTLADFEARSGSKATQQMMVGNMNSVIMLRTINADTQQSLSDLLPEIPVSYVMRSASVSVSDQAADGAYGVSHDERLMHEKEPMIAPQTFGDLTDLEFFIRTPRGRMMKGRLPILEAPGPDDHRSLALYAAEMDGSAGEARASATA